jgi:hypothetical protein
MVRSLFVATPMYGGQCYGAFADSVIRLAVECNKRSINFHFFPLFNESHIDRARNVCVEHFLRSTCDDLLFIDADISFSAIDAIDLIEQKPDVVCGFYPKKEIDWKRVIQAIKLGWGDKHPEVLERFATQLVYTPALDGPTDDTRSIYELVEVHEGGTGFMRIRRGVFEKIDRLHPQLRYPTEMGSATCFFDARLDNIPHKRFLSEDYAFCALARAADYKIWLAPWIKLTHHGYYRWIGDIEALAKVTMKEAA